MTNQTTTKKEESRQKPTTYKDKTIKDRIRTFGLKKPIFEFFENISIMLTSGMSFVMALDSVIEETSMKKMKNILLEVKKKIVNGVSISKALNDSGIMSQHMYALIHSGEMTGRLSENFSILVLQNEKDELFRSKIRSSLLYGTVVLTITILVGIGVAWYILPQISEFFVQLDTELPFITKVLIAIGAFVQQYGIIVFPLAGSFLIVLLYFLFSFPKTKFIGHSFLFKIPLIKKLIMHAEVARFGFLFGTMLEAGMPILDAIESLESSTTFNNYKAFYRHLRSSVESGQSIQVGFETYPKVEKLFPSNAKHLLVAAEKSGNIPETLKKIGAMQEVKTESLSRNIPVLIEPILLVFVGIAVAVLALGILLPIYNINF